MGVLTREEREGLIRTISRRWHLWSMHNARETQSEAPRTFTPAYDDHVLLYEALTHGFDEAEAATGSREALLTQVEALKERLEVEYAVALRD